MSAEEFNNQDVGAHDIHLYFEMGRKELYDPAMVEALRIDFQEEALSWETTGETPPTEPETDEPIPTPEFQTRKEKFTKIANGQPYEVHGQRLINPDFDPRLVIHIYKTAKGWNIDLNGITQTTPGKELKTWEEACIYANQMALQLTKKVRETLEAEMRKKENLH